MGTENSERYGLNQIKQLRHERELTRLRREYEFALKELEHKHELEMLKLISGWLGRIFGCS